MNNEIEKIIAMRGGRIPQEFEENPFVQDARNRIENHLKYCKSELYKTQPIEIFYDFIFSDEMNAFCSTSQNENNQKFDFIGINIGAYFTILNIFNRMLAHRDIFPKLGNSEIEDNEDVYLLYLTSNTSASNLMSIFPKDLTRAVAALFLSRIAMDFLLFHEVGHLRHGHLEWIMATQSRNYIAEIMDGNANPATKLDRQALEMDADSFGTLHAMISACRFADHYIEQRKDTGFNEPEEHKKAFEFLFGDKRSTFKTITFSIYTLFRIFDISDWDMINPENYPYPNPLLRQYFSMVTIASILQDRSTEYNFTLPEYITSMGESIIDVEKACSVLLRQDADVRGIQSIMSEPGISIAVKHYELLEERWQKMRPFLEMNKRGGNLP